MKSEGEVLRAATPFLTRWVSGVTLGLLAASLLLPPACWARIFKYVDRDGNIHFVDDESMIPPEYRAAPKSYSEPDDDLSAADRVKLKAVRQREQEELEGRRRVEQEIKAREAYLKSLETPVTIGENMVLVPVEVGYGGRKAELTLVLDTGATHTVIYRNAVAGLGIVDAEKSVSQLAGGIRVRSYRVKLRSLKVGPWEMEDVEAILMDHVGPPGADQGLLGMDFLGKRDYRIDYEKQVIRWADPKKKGRE